MVEIVNCKQVTTVEGKVFTSIEIQGNVRLVKSKLTENYYLAANKTRISSALSLDYCRTLIGQKLPGTIEKIDCEPYEYINPETNEALTLHHTFVYSPDEPDNDVQQQQMNPYLFGQQQQPFFPQAQQIPMNFMQMGVVAEA